MKGKVICAGPRVCFSTGTQAINTADLCQSPRRSMSHRNSVLLANRKEEKERDGTSSVACVQITSPSEFQSFPRFTPAFDYTFGNFNQPSVDRRKQIRGPSLAADALAGKAKAVGFGFAFLAV